MHKGTFKINLLITVGYCCLLTHVALTAPDTQTTTGQLISLASPSVANLLHVPAYGVMAGLMISSLQRTGLPLGSTLLFAAVIAGVHGTVMELFQLTVPGRYASILDGMLNLMGILVMMGLYCLAKRIRAPRLYSFDPSAES